MKNSPFVAVVIPNYNAASTLYKGKPILQLCLESLRKTDYNNYKVLIIDNSSTDNSKEIVRKFNEVEFVRFKSKGDGGGIPKTNNYGYKYALRKYNPDYIMMYNTDMLVKDREWMKKLVAFAEVHKDAGLVGCKLLYPTGRIQHAGMIIDSMPRNRGRGEIDKGQYDGIEEVDGVTAALWLIKKSVIKDVGFFDERFYSGFDDTDYCIRVKRAGYRIFYYGKTSIIHFEGFTSANSADPEIRDRSFYNYQLSYAYYAFKNFGILGRAKMLAMALARAFISAEDKDRQRGIASIRLRDRIPWRIKVTIKAIIKSYNIYCPTLKFSGTKVS